VTTKEKQIEALRAAGASDAQLRAAGMLNELLPSQPSKSTARALAEALRAVPARRRTLAELLGK
jgi:hypothetical protein